MSDDNDRRVDGQELTSGDRIGFYLTKDGKIKSLPTDTSEMPEDARPGGRWND